VITTIVSTHRLLAQPRSSICLARQHFALQELYCIQTNKCIGDDTKAAARQSLNCIKNKKNNKIWRKTIFNMAGDRILTPCNVACGSGIVTVNSANGRVTRGSGMTCHWIRPNVRHIGILHLVWISTTSSQLTCHSAPCSLRNFIQIGPPSAEKNDVMSIFKIADLSHLGF